MFGEIGAMLHSLNEQEVDNLTKEFGKPSPFYNSLKKIVEAANNKFSSQSGAEPIVQARKEEIGRLNQALREAESFILYYNDRYKNIRELPICNDAALFEVCLKIAINAQMPFFPLFSSHNQFIKDLKALIADVTSGKIKYFSNIQLTNKQQISVIHIQETKLEQLNQKYIIKKQENKKLLTEEALAERDQQILDLTIENDELVDANKTLQSEIAQEQQIWHKKYTALGNSHEKEIFVLKQNHQLTIKKIHQTHQDEIADLKVEIKAQHQQQNQETKIKIDSLFAMLNTLHVQMAQQKNIIEQQNLKLTKQEQLISNQQVLLKQSIRIKQANDRKYSLFFSVPETSLTCPITLEMMNDPVIGDDGNTYNRPAIEEWLKRNGTSPLTRQPMKIDSLIPNKAVRELIESYNVNKSSFDKSENDLLDDFILAEPNINETQFSFER